MIIMEEIKNEEKFSNAFMFKSNKVGIKMMP